MSLVGSSQAKPLEAQGWGQVAGPSVVLGHDVAEAGEHGHAAVLQLHIAPAAEGGRVVRLREA